MKQEFIDGQIFIDETGCSFFDGVESVSFNMFEYRRDLESGAGGIYNGDGSPTYYFWAHPSRTKELINIPGDILYSFKHGTWQFSIKKEDLKSCDSNLEIVKNSDFKFVSESDVEESKLLKSIETIDDIKNNWELIKSGKATIKIIEACLHYVNIPIEPCQNGEIGIWAHSLWIDFYGMIDYIEVSIFNPQQL